VSGAEDIDVSADQYLEHAAIVHDPAAYLIAQLLPRDQAAERLDRVRIPEPYREPTITALEAIARAGQAWKDTTRQRAAPGDTEGDRVAGALHAGTDGCELLSQQQVAAVLGVHPRTVGRMLDRGDLPAVPAGRRRRVARRALARYLAANTDQEPVAP
jgi:excisionase family DNA binding protein